MDWIGSVYTKGIENKSNPFKITRFFFPVFGLVLFFIFRFGYRGLHWIGLDMNTPSKKDRGPIQKITKGNMKLLHFLEVRKENVES